MQLAVRCFHFSLKLFVELEKKNKLSSKYFTRIGVVYWAPNTNVGVMIYRGKKLILFLKKKRGEVEVGSVLCFASKH